MKITRYLLILFFINIFLLANSKAATYNISKDIELNDLILMELEDGVVVINTFPDKAPGHVYRVKLLIREGFYDGLGFFRVIDDFIAQTGDPTNTGTGGSKFGKMYAEINDLKHTRGMVSMARASDINSADSQFFIVTSDYAPHLDGEYTIWGQVIGGMELIDNLKSSTDDQNGIVKDPDKIVKMILMQDLNYNYEGDTEEQIESRRLERISMLNNLGELKKINDQINKEQGVKTSLLDRILELNENLE